MAGIHLASCVELASGKIWSLTNPRRQVKVNYLSLSSGASTKTLCPLALADTGLRWHLRAYDRERGRFADFALTRIVKAKAIEQPIPVEEQIESDVQWARLVHIELVPHPGIAHPKAIEADFMMHNGMLALDMRAPLVGYECEFYCPAGALAPLLGQVLALAPRGSAQCR